MENLPGDVLCNIFIRLQAKLVAQMRCVSKPFNSLLSQPSFIKSHLNRSLHNNDEILMVFQSPFFFRNKPFMMHPTLSCNFIQLPANTPSKDTACCVIGSVNGLICFSKYNGILRERDDLVIYIWNPSLSALLTLPPSTIHSCGSSVLLRFGFDPKNDDYKLVKLNCLERKVIYSDESIFSFKKWLQVEMYSMRKGSWQLITQRFPSHVTRIYDQNEVCIDGHDGRVHWLGDLGKEQKLQTIVAFDFGAETFNEICLPDSIACKNHSNVLGNMAGKLCVISHDRVGECECEVWIMEEYGVAKSWMIHHVFSRHSDIYKPVGFTLSNGFLVIDNDYCLAKYASDATYFKSIMIVYIKSFLRTKVVHYVDSLVWVAPPKRGINISSTSKDGFAGRGTIESGFKPEEIDFGRNKRKKNV